MGLIVDIYRSKHGDCTNRGMSAEAEELCLVNVDGPFDPGYLRPAAMLVKGNLAGTVKIVPAERQSDGKYIATKEWTMMGGNYAATSDGRFHQAVRTITGTESQGAVPIHDRIE